MLQKERMFSLYYGNLSDWSCKGSNGPDELPKLGGTMLTLRSFGTFVFILFLMLVSSCTSNLPDLRPPSDTLEASLPNAAAALLHGACSTLLAQADWRTTDLYSLTYQCVPPQWNGFFNSPKIKAELKQISDELSRQVSNGAVPSPSIGHVFRALYFLPPSQVKAVILGQDPAPQKGQATGLSFSLLPGVSPATTPSVQRVMLEAENEGICMNMQDGDLSSWAREGTLMLNTALTLPCPDTSNECEIGAHLSLWTNFSMALIEFVETQPQAIGFLLWGSEAAHVQTKIKSPKHRALVGGHPSPAAPGSHFFCQNYFNCANSWLTKHGSGEIKWGTAAQCAPVAPCIWAKGNPAHCEQACALAACPS
jgi:uracil-DNA glycosylase